MNYTSKSNKVLGNSKLENPIFLTFQYSNIELKNSVAQVRLDPRPSSYMSLLILSYFEAL